MYIVITITIIIIFFKFILGMILKIILMLYIKNKKRIISIFSEKVYIYIIYY